MRGLALSESLFVRPVLYCTIILLVHPPSPGAKQRSRTVGTARLVSRAADAPQAADPGTCRDHTILPVPARRFQRPTVSGRCGGPLPASVTASWRTDDDPSAGRPAPTRRALSRSGQDWNALPTRTRHGVARLEGYTPRRLAPARRPRGLPIETVNTARDTRKYSPTVDRARTRRAGWTHQCSDADSGGLGRQPRRPQGPYRSAGRAEGFLRPVALQRREPFAFSRAR